MERSNAVFISYRRRLGGLWALAVYQALTRHPTAPVDVFYDIEALRQAGKFNQRLLAQIEARPYFLLVLTPGTLDRCASRSDWLRREIDHAIATDRVIIPLFTPGFDAGDFSRYLPAATADELSSSQGLDISEVFFSDAMERLHDELLVPREQPTRVLGLEDERYHRLALADVEDKPLVTDTQLAEREIAQRTVAGGGQLPPPNAHDAAAGDAARANVVHHRALILEEQGDLRGAIGEMEQAVQLDRTEPDHASELVRLRRRRFWQRWKLAGWAAAGVAAVVLAIVVVAAARDDDRDEETTTTTGGSGSTFDEDSENASDRSVLEGGERLGPGDRLTSADGSHVLRFTGDGVLAASTDGVTWWAQPAYEPAGAYAELQTDGNFVVYEPDGSSAVWATGTDGNDGAVLRVEHVGGRGAITIYGPDGTTVWRVLEGPRNERSMLRAHDTLERGGRLMSSDGRHTLTFTDDGVLVAAGDGEEWWREPTSGSTTGEQAVMQADGNFVVYGPDGHVWATRTHEHPGAYFVLEGGDEPAVVVFDRYGGVLWRVTPRSEEASTSPPSTAPATTTHGSESTAATTVVVPVPSVVGLDAADARAQIEAVGLIADVVPVASTEQAGVVVRQDPAAGTEVEEGSSVRLYVAEPAATTGT